MKYVKPKMNFELEKMFILDAVKMLAKLSLSLFGNTVLLFPLLSGQLLLSSHEFAS